MRIIVLLFLSLFSIHGVARAAPAPEVFGKLPMIYDAAISPDASQIAIIMNFGGYYGIRVLTLGAKGEEPRLIALGDGVKPGWIRWANEDRVLAGMWQSQRIGATPVTTSHIYTLDASSMKGKILVQSRDIVRQDNSYVIDWLEHDPKHILMGYSERNQLLVDVHRVNVKDGRDRIIERARQGVERWYTDKRGEPRVGQGRIERCSKKIEWNLIIREVERDKWHDADEFPGLEPGVAIFGFTDDLNELVIGLRAGRDTMGLYVYDLAQKEVTRELFHNDTYDASGLVTGADGEVIGATYVADSDETELFGEFETVLGRVRKQFPQYTVDYVDQSRAGERILVRISHAFDPGALAMVESSTGEVKMLAAYRSELPPAELGVVLPVDYPARDGFEIPAYVTLPPTVDDASNLAGLPFVVLPHGGPFARDSRRFDYFSQFFATRGFGVLQMNFRGSAGYGKRFEDAGRENWVQMQHDVEDGTRWLIAEGYADPGRICIAGWSYGGYAALMGAIKNPELYACAVSMAGVTDLKDLVRDMRQYAFGAAIARNSILSGFDGKDDLLENSPVRRARELTVPLLLAHGTKDERVHFDQFRRMRSALKKSPAETTFLVFKDEDHYLSSEANRIEFFESIDAFLNSTVGESEFIKQ